MIGTKLATILKEENGVFPSKTSWRGSKNGNFSMNYSRRKDLEK